MHHPNLLKRTGLILMSAVFAVSAHADPNEIAKQTLTRSTSSGLVLQAQLIRNAYNQEAYQDTETYYVDVPYEEQEAYTDYETYYSNDYVCHDYTDYERQCRTVRDCDDHNDVHMGIQSVALDSVIGRPRDPGNGGGPAPFPGGGGGGSPRPEPPRPAPPAPAPAPRPAPPAPRPAPPAPAPAPRPEPPRPTPPAPAPAPRPEPPRPTPPSPRPDPRPEPGPGPRPGPRPEPRPEPGPGPRPWPRPRPPECHDREVCENVPVTKQQCGYEQVAHTQPVTRYRTVTKYRSEARTREVTKYRDVYDHQWAMNVQVQFPQGVELNSAESENFTVELTGTEAAPDIALTPVSTVFGYKIASKTVNKGLTTIVLAQVPRYKAADLAEKSLENFTAVPSQTGLNYKFFDDAILPRVASRHQLIVQDAATHQVVAQTDVRADSQREIAGQLDVAWDYSRNYELVLKVHREGSVIENNVVDFEVHQPLSLVVDNAALSDESKVTPTLVGSLAQAQVIIRDATVPYATVQTRYYVSLIRKNSMGKNTVFGEKGFSRTSLKAGADGAMFINIADFGMSSSDIQSYLKSGSKVQVVVQVDRATSDGKKVQFWQSATVDVK